jgi:hypothetical protein
MQAAIDEGAIRQRAYAIWEAEGRPHGREWDHWLRAAEELGETAPPARPRRATQVRKTPARGRIRAALKSMIPA